MVLFSLSGQSLKVLVLVQKHWEKRKVDVKGLNFLGATCQDVFTHGPTHANRVYDPLTAL